MEGNRALDLAGSPASACRLRFALVVAALACLVCLPVQGQHEPVVEDDYQRGMALAQLGRWDEARLAFLNAQQRRPGDKRFPVELAGIAFKQKRYEESASWLRAALRLDPQDRYALDFLGTVYFLQGNLEAALKYWNLIEKPRIENVRTEAELRVAPAVLDRAFAFSPAAVLQLRDLLTTEARVGALGIFPLHHFELAAREDGDFDLIFRATERTGWGSNRWEGLLRLFRGVFQQTLYPEYFNLGGSAINFVSLVRWDSEKRRLSASLSGPFRQDAKRRYRLALDLRNENWQVNAPTALAGLNLRRESVEAGILSISSGRWNWSTGIELSHRDFRSVTSSSLTQALLSQGYQLKHTAEVNHELWRVPERRLVATTTVSSELARIWSQPGRAFAKLQAGIAANWFPRPAGDDYQMQGRLSVGKTFGESPFDELFMLGLERDNDLWLRAHVGTRDGRKGNAPLGGNYVLTNWEVDKNVFGNGLVSVKLGPFLDSGRVTGVSGLGSRKWLWDTGAQAKVRLLGIGVALIYGKDLRSGNNTFYATVGR